MLGAMVESDAVRDVLAQAWRAVLAVSAAPDADFYALGGDSLAAMRIATAFAEAFAGIEDLDALVMTEILDIGRYGDIEEAVLGHVGAL
jgi:hypothetical protein